MKKKTVSMFMGLVLGVTTVFSSIGPAVVTVSAAESGVTDSKCKKTGTPEPAADDVVPDANQYKYQKDELAAFCHFGPIHSMKLSGESITEIKSRVKSLSWIRNLMQIPW